MKVLVSPEELTDILVQVMHPWIPQWVLLLILLELLLL